MATRRATPGLGAGLLVLLAALPLWSQEEQPQPPGPKPLEDLLKAASENVRAMRQDFEQLLKETIPLLAAQERGAGTVKLREAKAVLLPWASVFAGELVATIVERDSRNLRLNLLDLLRETRDPRVAVALAEVLGKGGPELDAEVIGAMGALGNRAVAVRIRAAAAPDAEPRVRAAGLVALALLGDPEVADLAREALGAAEPGVRAAAAVSMAHAATEREDADRVIAVARDDADPTVRAAALRALAALKGSHDARGLLHDVVGGEDPVLVAAALDALAVVADRELSKPYLRKVVKGKLDVALRERAARILLALGDRSGVLHLVEPLRQEADRRRSERNPQRICADELRRLGAYEDALTYYDRAIDKKLSPRDQYLIYAAIARCQAALGRFGDAKRTLQKVGYTDFSSWRDDPEFAAMRKDPEYRELFEPK